MYELADDIDRREGRLAYQRYHQLLSEIAARYQRPMLRVTAAFVALSPNSDYKGNLRSLVSCLHGLETGTAPDRIVVSTYKHCRDRALRYLCGYSDFLFEVKGPKTRSFFMNIMCPWNPDYVTVDGHIYAAWSGRNLTMKEAKMGRKVYASIAKDVQRLAGEQGMLPCQMQATLWFTRKRVSGVLSVDQLSLFAADDQWGTLLRVQDIKPYSNEDNTVEPGLRMQGLG